MATYYVDYELWSDSNDGSSWANAFKTITQASPSSWDVVKVAKSPAPSAVAWTTATWTNLSKTVTLNTAETADITACETAWTASTNVTATTTTTRKEGSYASSIAIWTSFTTWKAAYFATWTLDLSSYQKISLWLKLSSTISASDYKICLCSDTEWNTIVDTFYIPATPNNYFAPITIWKDWWWNLGSSIQSIAIYVNTDVWARTVVLDNIIACTTNWLNLQSLISKNSSEQWAWDWWYWIQSINGTTVLIDNTTSTNSNSWRWYCWTTETVNTYKRETIKSPVNQSISANGSLSSFIEYQWWYDVSTWLQTWETFFDWMYWYTTWISIIWAYYNIGKLNFYRYWTWLSCDWIYINIDWLILWNCWTWISYDTSLSLYIDNTYIYNCDYSAVFTNYTNAKIENIHIYNSLSYWFSFVQSGKLSCNNVTINNSYDWISSYDLWVDCKINTLTLDNIDSYWIYAQAWNFYINNLINSSSLSTWYSCIIYINKLWTTNYWKIYESSWYIVNQASTLTNGSWTEWKFTTDGSDRNIYWPLRLSIAKIACVADKLVTVKCWFKKWHATNIWARLVFDAMLWATESISTASNTTDEQELTITFTPTEAWVAEIFAEVYYIAWDDNVIIDEMTITQAD